MSAGSACFTKRLVHPSYRAAKMRDRDGAAHHEGHIKGIKKFCACHTHAGALLNVISNTVITAQHD